MDLGITFLNLELGRNMFKRKNRHPVFTASYCLVMEYLRLALEVQTGKRVLIDACDFNTLNMRVVIGGDKKDISLINLSSLPLRFLMDKKWYIARFYKGTVTVCDEHHQAERATVAGNFSMRWVGTSFVDRREEPLFLENAEYCAKARGLTLQELLDGKGIAEYSI